MPKRAAANATGANETYANAPRGISVPAVIAIAFSVMLYPVKFLIRLYPTSARIRLRE